MTKATTGRRTLAAILIPLIVITAILILTWWYPGLYRGFEMKTYDIRFAMKVGNPGDQDLDDVVIVDVDDKSLQELGRFQNWPRLYHALVIDYLKTGNAAAIGFDILLPESDSLKPEMIQLFSDTKTDAVDATLSKYKNNIKPGVKTPKLIESVLSNWGYDQDLAAVAKEAGVVYFPIYFSFTSVMDTASDIPIRDKAYQFSAEVTDKYSYVNISLGMINRVSSVTLPVNILLDASKGISYVNVEQDEDGTVRHHPLFLSLGDYTYPSWGLQLACDKLDVKPEQVSVVLGKMVRLGDKRNIPIDEEGRMLINYFGQFKKFRYISYSDVLLKRVPAEYFAGKIIIIGVSAAGLMDLRVVPFSNTFPGPEIHANIIHSILVNDFINQLPWYWQYLIILGLGFISAFMSWKYKPLAAGILILLLIAIYIVFATVLFGTTSTWIEIIRPLATIVLVNLAIISYRYLTEEKQKLWIKDMFQGYMSKDLVDKIMANPDMLMMGGDKKEITVFFSDIKGFSSFSEKLGTPERLIALINEYLGAMSDVVLEHGGYISKYEGDAIMAFWGAPSDDPRHAETCIKCVWAMNQRLKALNADLAKRDMPNLFTRFGINTGPVTVGNVGSVRKKSYTAMGDSVNLGSRLEGANKEYGTAIMISEFTCEKVKGLYPVRELDMLRVVGKEQPVRVYELLGLSEADVPEAKKKAVELYLKGLESYRARKWDEAIALFNQALAADPGDGPSKTYIERCEEFKTTPPPGNWDGVFVMKTK